MEGDGIWIHVKALIDGLDFKAPIEHVQDFSKVEKELRANHKRDEYLVFYSPKETDTPESLRRAEGRVLKIDDLDKRSYATELKRHKQGIPGWYKASLLQWEESLEDLNSVVSPNDTENLSRSSRGSSRMQRMDSKSSKKDSHAKKSGPSSRSEMKIAHEAGRKQNLECSRRTSDLSPGSSEELDGDLDTQIMVSKVQRLTRKCGDQAEEIKELKAALKSSEEERSALLKINTLWQEKELKRKKSGSSSKHKSDERLQPYQKSAMQRGKTVPNRTETRVVSESDSALEEGLTTDSVVDSEDTSDEQHDMKRVNLNSSRTPLSASGRLHATPTMLPSPSSPSGGKANSTLHHTHNTPKSVKPLKGKQTFAQFVDMSEEDFMKNCAAPDGVRQITYEQFESFLQKAKAGQAGDSVFMKECMGVVWDDEELATRSAVGGYCAVQQSGDKKPLTPSKKTYVINLLKYRISHEPGAEENDMIQRTMDKVINKIANSKICSVNLSIKKRTQQ